MSKITIIQREATKLKNKESLYVRFDYNIDKLAKIKSLPNRFYIPETKEWEVPIANINNIVALFQGDEIEILGKVNTKISKAVDEVVSFDKINIDNFEFKTKPFQHQIEFMQYALDKNKFLLGDEQGLGKALTMESKLYTPDGFILMKDVKVGDYVMGDDGKPTKVLAVYPQGEVDIYRVEFTDGSSVECCKEHLWAIQPLNYNRDKKIRIMSTEELINDGLRNKYNYKFSIPIAKAVEFNNKDLIIKPYDLGVLLGDGYLSGKGEVVLDNGDNLVEKMELNFVKPKSCTIHYYLVGDERKRIYAELQRLGLAGCKSDTKFIPSEYKYNSIENRLELLRGLMDTDGYVTETGDTVEFYTTSERLKDDIIELIQSLGCITKVKESIGKYTKNGITKECKKCYTIRLILNNEFNPFSLKRKADRVVPRTKYPPKRSIVNIEYVGKKEAQCITVDNENSLYLTDNFIVTHNTKQAIDIAVARKSQFKHCLIVCGVNALKWNWENEIKIHSNEKGRILGIQTKQNGKRIIGTVQDRYNDLCKNHDEFFLITNIETLRDKKIQAKIKELTEKGIIGMTVIDEIHKCKNAQSSQGKAIQNCKSFYKLAMTGTPLMNEPIDLFNILKWLDVEHHSYTAFRSRYCIMGGYGNYQIVGYKNLQELNELLESNMLRRLKKDRLDLPPKIKTNEYVELTPKQKTLYTQVEKDIKAQVDQIKLDPNPLSKLIRLRQVTGCPTILSSQVEESVKLDRMVELIEESVGNNGKVIVFSNWATMIQKAFDKINPHYQPQVITGKTKDEDRIKHVEKFQTGENCRVILGTIGAMGTGLTLTSADTVIFLDEPWNLANKEQAEDRSHRIGQKKSVNIITLIAKDTIDERINAIVMKKGLMAEALVDGQIDKLSKSNMVDFLLDL